MMKYENGKIKSKQASNISIQNDLNLKGKRK